MRICRFLRPASERPLLVDIRTGEIGTHADIGSNMTSDLARELDGLPVEVTSFVGRREAAARVKHALSESRLVTLTGVGGVGKSRLALRVARNLRRAFTDGVWWVDLAKLQDSEMVDRAVTATLGLRDQSVRSQETILTDFLTGKKLLLILDNCEHVLGSSARLSAKLLTASPGLRVLATSREPLGVAGESIVLVPPLSLSELDELDQAIAAFSRPRSDSPEANWPDQRAVFTYPEAVQLFEDRARTVLPSFAVDRSKEAVVSRLCQRLDGVPPRSNWPRCGCACCPQNRFSLGWRTDSSSLLRGVVPPCPGIRHCGRQSIGVSTCVRRPRRNCGHDARCLSVDLI